MINDVTALAPDPSFAGQASNEQIDRTAQALEANGMHALIAENRDEARRMFFELVPEGSEVFLGASVTLEALGIKEVIDKSGKYDALRPKMFAMNRETQAREIRKLAGAPDYAAGSVQAVTEDGQVLIASKTGSQLGPYASGAGNVIWVVGAQKIVRDLDEGLRRIDEYCVPTEEENMQARYNSSTYAGKILIVKREFRPGRVTIIIVKEALGF
jgi:L-lactate utilization protein LutC